jgi:hypothetical protein
VDDVFGPLAESTGGFSPVSAVDIPALLTTAMPSPTATAIPATRETCLPVTVLCLTGGRGPAMGVSACG